MSRFRFGIHQRICGVRFFFIHSSNIDHRHARTSYAYMHSNIQTHCINSVKLLLFGCRGSSVRCNSAHVDDVYNLSVFRLNCLNLATSNCKANYVNLICKFCSSRHFLLLRPCVGSFFLRVLVWMHVFIALDVQSVCSVWCKVESKRFSTHENELYAFSVACRKWNVPEPKYIKKIQNLPYAIKCVKEFSAVALPCNVIWHSTVAR